MFYFLEDNSHSFVKSCESKQESHLSYNNPHIVNACRVHCSKNIILAKCQTLYNTLCVCHVLKIKLKAKL